MQIIGLGHYSRVGKDTLANFLVEGAIQRGKRAKKLPFAWKLKQICHELYGWDGLREPEFYDTPAGERYRDVKLPTLGMTPVQVWVAFGTPAVRENVYHKTWVDYVLKTDHQVDLLVIPDVRFPNEVEAIREVGGTLIKVIRPGLQPRKTVADLALANNNDWFDYVVGATGFIDELRAVSETFVDWVCGGPKPLQSLTNRMNCLAAERVFHEN